MSSPLTKDEVVSDESEPLILVNAHDEEIGTLDKEACHDGDGVLHRAISVFVFNPAGALLMQRRHPGKRLWGGYWSNSCCSHPRKGEQTGLAAARRLEEELGLATTLEFLFKFEYTATFGDVGTEHELCSVFVGHCADQPIVNTTEIDAWEWIAPDALDRRIQEEPNRFTPWLKIEWARLRKDFSERLVPRGKTV